MKQMNRVLVGAIVGLLLFGGTFLDLHAQSSDIAINFRQTAGYATDDATETYAAAAENYQTSRGGESFGISSGTVGHADRDSALDRRLAGIMFGASSGTASQFRIDLSQAGAYTVYLAMGDGGSAQTGTKVVIKDTTTTKLTIGPHNVSLAHFYDASDVDRTAAAWPTDNVGVSVTFATTQCIIELGDGSNNGLITHIRLVLTTAPGCVPNGLILMGVGRSGGCP